MGAVKGDSWNKKEEKKTDGRWEASLIFDPHRGAHRRFFPIVFRVVDFFCVRCVQKLDRRWSPTDELSRHNSAAPSPLRFVCFVCQWNHFLAPFLAAWQGSK